MKKINKILVGTHNQGKFDEISFLLSKKIKKISPKQLGIGSPKETGKTLTPRTLLHILEKLVGKKPSIKQLKVLLKLNIILGHPR